MLETAGWLEHAKGRLSGQLIEYTRRHGLDRRIWSPTLHEWRDMYVYLPSGFDPNCLYPVVLWLHGVDEDAASVIKQGGLEIFDKAMATGRLPPMIIAMPDGSLHDRPTFLGANPMWFNSRVGPFRDYLYDDIWPYVRSHFPIRPEREAHIVAGFSGGGSAAFRTAIQLRCEFGVCMAIHPDVNTRWLDCHGRYLAPFDPKCWGWRTDISHGREVVARFYCGLVVVRAAEADLPPLRARARRHLHHERNERHRDDRPGTSPTR